MASSLRSLALDVAIVGGGPGGLYAAILLKKSNPAHRVTLFERNAEDDTFGFGVVFSDETLGNFKARDRESYDAITNEFAYWGGIDTIVRGQTIRSEGHGFCGIERKRLLMLLQERARGLGAELRYRTEVQVEPMVDATDARNGHGASSGAGAGAAYGVREAGTLRPHDLVIACDGIHSGVREQFASHFQPSFDWRRNRFCWLGSTRSLDAFTFAFKENAHGIWILGAYQYKEGRSTWVPECSEATWRAAGLDQASEQETVRYLEELFAEELAGHHLLTNRSIWRTFPMIQNAHWFKDNVVLLGDALHTAHYSIGSGTKLAMEDAIALVDAIEATDGVAAALARFETVRREEVEKTQHAADVSLTWFEEPERFWRLDPVQLTFSLLTRSKQITYENLRRRDPAYVTQLDRWWARQANAQLGLSLDVENPPPPMFTPFRLREMWLSNRVVVSPMGMYSAVDGTPTDFHLVHLGGFALGGAGLVFAETTHISPESRITPGCCGIYTDEHVVAWRRITEFVHGQTDAKICLQLGHAGRKGSTRLGWEGTDLPLADGNWPIVSASPLPFRAESQTPIEIDRAEMLRVLDQFVRAAQRAEEAGFDMIELHMAHGYLLSSFLSPATNRRTDAYGGALENRLRFPLEVFDAVRAAWPAAKPMSVRISATDWVEGGLSGADSVRIAEAFKAHGVDLMDVSAGQTTNEAQPVYGRMFQTPFADAIRNDADIATIAVGNITSADQVNTIVASGRADLVALARMHLSYPRFTLQASAHYGHAEQSWPRQYGPGRDQAFRLAQRSNADAEALNAAARPELRARQSPLANAADLRP
ncbi:MAG: FAD-dependent monooxygenase [Burkholderiaceae bacterium]